MIDRPNSTGGRSLLRPFARLVEQAGNTLLRLDPESMQRLAALEGSVLAVEMREPDLRLYLLPTGEGIRIEQTHQGALDVTLRGTLWSFVRLGREGMQGDLFHDGSLEMSGDAELGQQYQQLLARLDLDWEEILARLVGDTPARKLGNLIRALGSWATEAGASIRRNIGEVLQEEKRELASGLQAEEFVAGVDALRSDVERLEQRVERLRKRYADRSD